MAFRLVCSPNRTEPAPHRLMRFVAGLAIVTAISSAPSVTMAQSVCLPSPRLLTTMPMGGQAGTQVEVTITSEYAEDVDELRFSSPLIAATPKLNAEGLPEPNKFAVTIAADCPAGLHEARLMTRLGVSSSRVFTVSELPEVVQAKPNTSLDNAMPLQVNSICNSVTSPRAIDYYSFEAKKGQRIVVDCAAEGIDSKLVPVLVIADEQERDLLVERRGGALDFHVPEDGKYVIKVHDLTYSGGVDRFYRLVLQTLPADSAVPRHPSTRPVNAFSWPPVGLAAQAATPEVEPNNQHAEAQKITLPCDISGSFFPAADVDRFEFTAKKGEIWWVEIASERFGLPTDPAMLVQRVTTTGEGAATKETLVDVVQFSDIPSPVKVSSNGYAYDGPAYNAGTSDFMAKLEIKEDGVYRMQLIDLFGGTRNDPANVYRLVVRQAQPDFAVVGWALHMGLRNGDRNALSKPIALRGGATMALEVVVIRRDGFNEEIELGVDGLPEGVTAAGMKIPAGKSRGIIVITAAEQAPRTLASPTFYGRAQINGETVTRPLHVAAPAWPIRDAWSEIPKPRLMVDVPVSVSGSEFAPLTVTPSEDKVWEVTAGETLTLPLTLTRRSEFSGKLMQLHTFGDGFEGNGQFEIDITADTAEAVLDTAKLKTKPGDYLIAFYGGAVAKYRYNPLAVAVAEAAHKKLTEESQAAAAEATRLAEVAKNASEEEKANADKAAADAAAKLKDLQTRLAAAGKKVEQTIAAAKPKDIADIVVSTPIAIRVQPAEKK